MKDPYKILGIKSDATFHQIKKAYFSKVKAFSPERYPQEFKRIREAYELLKDEKGRKESEFFQFKEFQPKFYKIESLEKEIKLNIEELIFNAQFLSDLGMVDFKQDFQQLSWDD